MRDIHVTRDHTIKVDYVKPSVGCRRTKGKPKKELGHYWLLHRYDCGKRNVEHKNKFRDYYVIKFIHKIKKFVHAEPCKLLIQSKHYPISRCAKTA